MKVLEDSLGSCLEGRVYKLPILISSLLSSGSLGFFIVALIDKWPQLGIALVANWRTSWESLERWAAGLLSMVLLLVGRPLPAAQPQGFCLWC